MSDHDYKYSYEGGSYNDNKSNWRYPAELSEIAEMIASRQPRITVDDICNCLIDIWQHEQQNCQPIKNHFNKPKYRKLVS